MKIRRATIDGYGRFANRRIEFAPGLQVVLGPNEQGKSTLRAFIADMLYGQKRSTQARSFDEAHTLRTPWHDPDTYGGTLLYELDNGHVIEVVRNFSKKHEAVHVFDRTAAREITGTFEMLRNRELAFAEAQLGLSKDVFTSTATITHITLEDLGGRDALGAVREKLLSLADSGDASASSSSALARLKTRVTRIGQPTARTKPLPQARHRQHALEQEREAARAVQAEVAALAEQRRTLHAEGETVRARRHEIEAALGVLARHARVERLQEAEDLLQRIDTATQHCFALGALRDFPLDDLPQVQRVEQELGTARAQEERTRAELEGLRQQHAAEQQGAHFLALAEADAPPDEALAEEERLERECAQRRQRLEALTEARDEANEALAAAEAELARYPDFAAVAPEPVEWFSQLASSFAVALRTRDEEHEEAKRLRAEVEERNRIVGPYQRLFSQCEDFPAAAREYQLRTQLRGEQRGQRSAYLESLEQMAEELTDEAPAFRWLGAASAALAVGLLVAWFFMRVDAMLYAVGASGLAALYFASNLLYAGRRVQRLRDEADRLRTEAAEQDAAAQETHVVETLLLQSGCEEVAELERRYEAFRQAAADLAARQQLLRVQEQRTDEAADRVARLIERLRGTFEQVDEYIETEADVAPAAARAVGRYQGYRDVRRQYTAARQDAERLEAECHALAEALEACTQEHAAAAERVRVHLREAGYAAERQHATVRAAVAAFERACAEAREQRSRLNWLEDRRRGLEHRHARERTEIEQHERTLSALLERAGVARVEEWYARAEEAREYREVWNRRTALNEQLDQLLRGQDLEALRAEVAAEGELPPRPDADADALEAERDHLEQRAEALREEAHNLHVRMAQRAAAARSLNEIEEELDAVSRQVVTLEAELEATSYAMALIEDVARDKHARIAPQLAAKASFHLAEITEGAYDELLIGRDLELSVRIPATRRMHEQPEKTLSKGTVDQIYLALRLALVQSMSEHGERIPMLLDDPFANYDDVRLARTMALVARLAEDNQIVLFTCREDVARAAEAVEAPIATL